MNVEGALQLMALSLFLLALAVSLDSFSVGFTYGLRQMKIPFRSVLLIACCSAVTLLLAMLVGKGITVIVGPQFAESIGGSVLIILGMWALYQVWRSGKEQHGETTNSAILHDQTLVKLEIRSLGLVIHILRRPMAADIDGSGTITGLEALLLGVALSLDAFGAGIGASMLGLPPWGLAATVAVMSSLFVVGGIVVGKRLSHAQWVNRCTILPGIVLIMLGLWKI